MSNYKINIINYIPRYLLNLAVFASCMNIYVRIYTYDVYELNTPIIWSTKIIPHTWSLEIFLQTFSIYNLHEIQYVFLSYGEHDIPPDKLKRNAAECLCTFFFFLFNILLHIYFRYKWYIHVGVRYTFLTYHFIYFIECDIINRHKYFYAWADLYLVDTVGTVIHDSEYFYNSSALSDRL